MCSYFIFINKCLRAFVIFDLAQYIFQHLPAMSCSYERYKTFETNTLKCLRMKIPVVSDEIGVVCAYIGTKTSIYRWSLPGFGSRPGASDEKS
jgi:hypothetical protein